MLYEVITIDHRQGRIHPTEPGGPDRFVHLVDPHLQIVEELMELVGRTGQFGGIFALQQGHDLGHRGTGHFAARQRGQLAMQALEATVDGAREA